MMMSSKNKRIISVIAAVFCIAVFALFLYAAANPLFLKKIQNKISPAFDTTQDFVKFMDVGQGDSALIYSNGYSAVIDLGLPNAATDICYDLADCDIRMIDAVMVSHLHSDHIGSLRFIADTFEIKNLIMPEILKDSLAAAKSGKSFVTGKGSAYYNAKQGINFNIGEFEITVLGCFNDKKNENNRSIFAVAEIDGIKFMFTGDAEQKAEKLLLKENLNLDCDVLKVSHHGSDTACSKAFLKAVSPRYAVISVGEDNMYSHPHKKTLNSLEDVGAKVFRTDNHGDITFTVQDGKIIPKTEKN